MRGWTNLRRGPVFRLGLSLLALNEQLDPTREVARTQIRALIAQYLQQRPIARAGGRGADALLSAAEVAGAVSGIAISGADVVRDRARPVIGALLRQVTSLSPRDAVRYHRTVPEAEDGC